MMKISIKKIEFANKPKKVKASFDNLPTQKSQKMNSTRDTFKTVYKSSFFDLSQSQIIKIEGKNTTKSNFFQTKSYSQAQKSCAQMIHVNTLNSIDKKFRRSMSIIKTLKYKSLNSKKSTLDDNQNIEINSQKNLPKGFQQILKSYLKVKKQQSLNISSQHQAKYVKNSSLKSKLRIHRKDSIRIKPRKVSYVYGPWQTESNYESINNL